MTESISNKPDRQVRNEKTFDPHTMHVSIPPWGYKAGDRVLTWGSLEIQTVREFGSNYLCVGSSKAGISVIQGIVRYRINYNEE